MNTNMDLFDEYLNGELVGRDKLAFEERLQTDAAFSASFQQHKNAIRAIEFAAMKDRLGQISRDAQRSKTLSRGGLLAIAASLALLVGAYFFILDRVETPLDGDQIFASIHFKDPGLPTLMGDADGKDSGMDAFMLLYKQNKYEEAMQQVEDLLQEYDAHDTIQFYVAMIHLETGDIDKAAELLETLEIKEGIIGQKAEWYLLMVDLKRGDFIRAEAGLRLIAENPAHLFRMEAMEALDVLSVSLSQ